MKIILLDNIRSMNNVGAIFRTADGAGWDRVILTGYTPTPPRQQISKTALWAEKSVKWEYFEDPFKAVEYYRKEGFTVLAAEKGKTSVDYKKLWTLNFELWTLVLVVGNEVSWVSPTLLEASDHIIHLPMHGEKSSLNVAVAAGVLMYYFS